MAVTVRTLENFIGGEWVASTGESARAVVSPVTGETLAEAPNASADDVARAVAAARTAQPKWAALSAWERAKICHAIADLIDERREDFARELSLEQGKPYAAEALGDVGERLVTHPGVDCVGFVGSHPTAEKIVRAAGLKRSLIEASGNGPVVVCEDADLERAAQGAVFGGFFCAGQVCCATERVLVHEAVHDSFLDEVLKAAAAWRLGDPFDDSTLVGPMNNEPTAVKMDRHLEDAVDKGASVVLGGSRASDRPTSLYYEPTVVTDVGVDTLINRDETFGPIVPLIRVRSDEEALAVANDSHLGLQAAVYTSSLKRAFQYVDNLRVGNVVVNDSTDYWEAHEPFGGASGTQSGWGRIGGRYTMLDMSDLKTVVLDVGGLE